MCEKAFRKVRMNFNTMMKSEQMQSVVESFGFKEVDDLIIAVGYGKITPLQIIRKVAPKEEHADGRKTIFKKLISRGQKKKNLSGIIVKGADDIMVRFGKCCQPVPGDPIIGYITRGFGVTVHRSECINAIKTNPERLIEVQWNNDRADTFPVKIKIRAMDRMGLLADLAAGVSKYGANISSAHTKTHEDKYVECYFTITVEGTQQLGRVLVGLKKIKQVLAVHRVK
jgi:GTP pyrophosphokinase